MPHNGMMHEVARMLAFCHCDTKAKGGKGKGGSLTSMNHEATG